MTGSVVGLCLAVSLAAAGASTAVEPWTDPALPVKDGLELWLDASRMPAAAAAFSGTAPRPAAPLDAWHIDAWHDGSGHARHAAQTAWTSRPIYSRDPGQVHAAPALVRFDGTNDFLSLEVPGLVFDDVTIIIAAAPRSNPGGHRGLLAFSEPGKNDHSSGLNIDLGDRATDALERINVEGKGFPGAADLLAGTHNLGTLHVFTVTSSSREGSTRLRVDGKAEGNRPRAGGTLGAGRVTIGARSYNITGAPEGPTGFLSADIAEILVFSRVLAESEISSLERYLESKHAGGTVAGGAPEAEILRFLVPGFLVKELPVSLTNVNDLLYLPDGRLLLLTYDGRVLVLEDTDRDGLEESVQPFWAGAAFQSPIAMLWSGESLYVTSHGKVSSLRDTNGDGRLDREEIVLEGWVPPDVYTGLGVDALGAAMDRLGNLYVALGCADFTNPYLLRDGKARYDIRSERGTILKLSSLTREREIVSTGLRFPVSLAFNRRGDLFATDQEGETWCPGGNVLDELNHIVPGRYYGFPPRHEKHLPDVHDEPPVVAFGPQHQSTCGLLFNEEREGFLAFGPPFWEGDAFVAGFSRGKLWRVPLARTPAGYVGRSTLVASASRLLLDMAISPAGDMVIACHGGAPDWGTGPSGEGKLFKAAYSGLAAPQPVVAWAAGPLEARVAFDRPLADVPLEEAAGQGILFGENVRAGDRFEVHRPGYAAVEAQLASPTGVLAVRAVSLSEDRRTLRLLTDPHPLRARYALVLGGIRGPGDSTPGESADIDYDLGGVEAAWTAGEGAREGAGDVEDGARSWSGWLPHLDLAAARVLARGSAEIELLEGLLRRRGTLTLRSR
ncbi:MAG TPA: hypothetical protein VMT52_11870, partial [Planctomycetota bacterium]|nr:hypothetical protein [Planctomycetota bacterium]